MTDDLDSFGNIEIDGKPIHEPYLNYWTYRYGRKPLTREQEAFYNYFKSQFEKGIRVPVNTNSAYVALLKDELVAKARRYYSPPIALLGSMKRLMRIYNYVGYDLENYVEKYDQTLKLKRREKLAKTPVAKWIPFGQEVIVRGRVLVKGGFYLGTHLRLATKGKRNSVYKTHFGVIEGPVINDAPSEHDEMTNNRFETFREMSESMQNALLDYLEGKNSEEFYLYRDLINYYISGIEYKLFLDPETDNEERKEIIRNLDTLFVDDHLMIYRDDRTRLVLNQLIDYALIYFFSKDMESVFPVEKLSKRMVYIRSCMVDMIENPADVKWKSPRYRFEQFHHLFDSNLSLPKDVHDMFIQRFREEYLLIGHYNKDYKKHTEKSTFQFIGGLGHYWPDHKFEEALKARSIVSIPGCGDVAASLMSAYLHERNYLDDFISAYNEDPDNPMVYLNLPYYYDLEKLPQFQEIKARFINPECRYNVIPLEEIIRLSGLPYYVGSDPNVRNTMFKVENRLNKLGLFMSPSAADAFQVKPSDNITIFSRDEMKWKAAQCTGVPYIGLLLAAWLIQKDSPDQDDIDKGDRWIEQTIGASKSPLYLMGIWRWLLSRPHSLTQSIKRKATSTFTRFVNKRQELLAFLLTLAFKNGIGTKVRMKNLEKLYELLGQDAGNIHADLHQFALSGAFRNGGESRSAQSKRGVIDKKLLVAMEENTRESQQILSEVFDVAEPIPTPQSPKKKGKKVNAVSDEPPFMQVLRRLAEREEWTMEDFAQLCKTYNEIPNSALEKINDYAYDKSDEAVVDADDEETLYVDTALVKKLLE